MRRTLTLFLSLLVLWTVVTQLNHALTSMHIYLFTGALFVTFAALTQPFGSGFWASALAGLVFDANTPVAFGTHLLLFGATHVVLFRLRDRVPRNDTFTRVSVAVLANLVLFLVFSFVETIHSPAPAANWPRLLMDLVCSQVFLALVAPWAFALQARALEIARVRREERS
ncbi:MAG TPA: hypothetical protein VHE61_03410 [Opitutaceae bacterium]|nr:hypothetical protein [Opitutaceae bacterium]